MSWWDTFRGRFEKAAIENARAAKSGYPPTFVDERDPPGVRRAEVFDPALKHYRHGFRHGDPVFDDPEVEAAWRAARRIAMDHALAVVTAHPLGGELVLRGSRLLRQWYGDAAREPGDLDWVAPQHWDFAGPRVDELFGELAALVVGPARDAAPGIAFTGEVRRSELWTYERAPGSRLVLPWTATGVPGGSVQMDFVFGEALADAPVLVTFDTELPAQLPRPVRCASAALSLAWKLVWLVTDRYPQGKDLYDAVLLAESTRLPARVLDAVFATLPPEDFQNAAPPADTTRERVVAMFDLVRVEGRVDWDGFVAEMGRRGERLDPHDAYVARLIAALAA